MNWEWACGFGIDPGWGTVIGGGFVMVAAWQATRQAEKQRRVELHERQNSMKVAITSEVRLVAKQIRDRKWASNLQEAISRWDALRAVPGMSGPVLYTPLGRKFVRIYEANLPNIAMLGKHTHDVAEFYARIEAAIEINELLKDLAAGKGPDLGAAENTLELMKILRRMLSELDEFGELLAKVLESSVAQGQPEKRESR
ncbi:MAG: hypothetical protein KF802_04275 [Bdellovibrionaceae bacterium]|nr:hypothetical protein [Pseudobdellovibrionaceae bacterium]